MELRMKAEKVKAMKAEKEKEEAKKAKPVRKRSPKARSKSNKAREQIKIVQGDRIQGGQPFKLAETEIKGGIFENENVNIDLNKDTFAKKKAEEKKPTVKKAQ